MGYKLQREFVERQSVDLSRCARSGRGDGRTLPLDSL